MARWRTPQEVSGVGKTSFCPEGQGILRFKALCIFSHHKNRWLESHLKGSWRLGLLIGIYPIAPRCRALFHLDPVAEFIGKVLLVLDSQGALWPLTLVWVLSSEGTAL